MRARPVHAFTLIELMVAAGLTALLAGCILAVCSHMLAAWSRSTGLFSAEAEARIVLDQLALDLQSAIYRDDGHVWLAATVLDGTSNSGLWVESPRQKPGGGSSGSLRLNAANPREDRYGGAGIWLRFFTATRAENDARLTDDPDGPVSSPVAVAYQIIRRRPGANPASMDQRYLLHRSVARPAESGGRPGTIETGFNLDPAIAAGYAQADSANDGTWLGDPFGVITPDNPGCVLAENVVDFGIRLYRRAAGGGLTRIFPLDENDRDHSAMAPAASPDASACFPEVADVLVRVLTGEGVREVASLESPAGKAGGRPAQYRSDADWWWGIVEANSRVFTRRIVLPAQMP